jgi:hypothetical protein
MNQSLKHFFLVLLSLIFCSLPIAVNAATLHFSPSSGTHTVGSTFSISVYAESSSQALNAASGIVSFPSEKMEVVSISKSGSIFSLWAAEPSFSNTQGSVSFEGIVLNPGYTGANGKILTITFRARSVGTANVRFSSGSILANNGTGTNILNGLQVAAFTFIDDNEETSTVSQPEDKQVAPENTVGIVSVTHPDQSKWYANNTPEFSWDLPEGSLEVRIIIDTSSTERPTVSYLPPISTKKVDELPDGTYYFGLQIRIASGWSTISRYRVNIDTTPPKPFSITFPHGDKGWESQPVTFFNTTDGESGINSYTIKIGNDAKPVKTGPSTESNPYILPPQLPGTYALLVTAVDNAGNIRNGTAEFTIESIDTPVITYYPENLDEGDILKVRGTTYPNSNVLLYIREGDTLISEEYSKSNNSGDFAVVVTKRLDAGVYTLTARVKDERGAQSAETAPLTITVRSELITGLISFILKYLSAAILILLAVGALAWVGVRLWFKIPRTLARMRREAREAEIASTRALTALRKAIDNHIMRLKKAKRRLTKEEASFLEKFEDKLGEAEEIITKEIRDISKS